MRGDYVHGDDAQGDDVPAGGLSRRQFGLVLAGGALLVAAQGAYVISATAPAGVAARVPTAFGSLSVVRAGRLARLNAQGKPAFHGLAAAASIIEHGGGPPPVKMALAAAGGHGHGGGSAPAPAAPGASEPVNLTWPDVMVLEVRIQNDGPDPVLFSPGQLRLRLAGTATTVTPQDSDRTAGSIPGKAAESLHVSYLVPRARSGLSLEFTDAQHDELLALDLPALRSGGTS
ncbi:hypothetical protein [Zafaria cholistanensis]|uniref:hypothetical protein n=1 Tax=Zafaria cholistanensis TaxID=1682741 RepID=UPI001230ECD6|nr:hypothetical protein [Zafaria cholistanensis]